MSTRSAEALVLKRRDLGENDRVVTLLTREYGKVSAVARGSRKPGAKAAGATEPFTRLRVMLARGRRLDVLAQWDFIECHLGLRRSLGAVARAEYVCDLADVFTVEEEPCAQAFDLTAETLGCLNASAIREDSGWAEKLVAAYELQLLTERGYGLSLQRCAHCGQEIGSEAAMAGLQFSPAAGGLLCRRCRYAFRDGIAVSAAVVEAMRALSSVPPGSVHEIALSAPTQAKVRDCLRWNVRYRCEKDLKSASLLATVRAIEVGTGTSAPAAGLRE